MPLPSGNITSIIGETPTLGLQSIQASDFSSLAVHSSPFGLSNTPNINPSIQWGTITGSTSGFPLANGSYISLYSLSLLIDNTMNATIESVRITFFDDDKTDMGAMVYIEPSSYYNNTIIYSMYISSSKYMKMNISASKANIVTRWSASLYSFY